MAKQTEADLFVQLLMDASAREQDLMNCVGALHEELELRIPEANRTAIRVVRVDWPDFLADLQDTVQAWPARLRKGIKL